ncbi:MAG: FecR family protein [Ginsengibacter sp.]
MQHHENRLWKLLALKLSGDATLDELSELFNYLEQYPDEKRIAESIEVYWNQQNNQANINDEMEEERFHLIVNAESEEEVKKENNDIVPITSYVHKAKFRWMYAAASVVLILGLFFFFERYHSDHSELSSQKGIQQVFVKPGSKSKIILPDGTIVRLNGSSKLSYNSDFNKSVREVNLDGEAYFDVTKDANHPFIVHTSNIDIKVLGTLFNVKSYEQDPTIEATLLRGSIEVYTKDDPSAPKVILKPNEKLVFKKNQDDNTPEERRANTDLTKGIVLPDGNISISNLPHNKPDSTKEEISWLYNKLVIDGDDFTKMAKKMERWYGVKIEILSPGLEQYHFKGIFKNETIGQALDALQLTVKFRYKIKDDVIEITE